MKVSLWKHNWFAIYFIMRLNNRFAILHLLSVMLWNFVQSFFKPDFFLDFSKRYSASAFKMRNYVSHWNVIIHYYVSLAKHVAIKDSRAYNFFLFVEPSRRNGKTSDASSVNWCFIPCEFFIAFSFCLQDNAES